MKKARNIAFGVAVFLVIGCIVIAFATNIFTSVSVEADSNENTFTDTRDGKTYRTAKIGEQTWMAQNLNYAAEGSKCYNNDPANCDKYGRLYDWETAFKACPKGWHLPTNAEWDKLYSYADSTNGTESPYYSKTAGKKLKARNGWIENGNGTDEFGFAALPGGFGSSDGSFDYAGSVGYWWSSSEDGASRAYRRFMYYNDESAYWRYYSKTNLQSVRCVRD